MLCESRFDQHRLAFAFAALREQCRKTFGETLRCQAVARFDLSVGDRQSVVKVCRVGEIAHAELVQPLERAGAPLAADHHINAKLLRVHCVSLTLCGRSARKQGSASAFPTAQPGLLTC